LHTRLRSSFRRFHLFLPTAREKRRNLQKPNSAKDPKSPQTIVRAARVQSHLSRGNYLRHDRTPHSVIRGNPISSQRFFGSVSKRGETIWCPIETAVGTSNGPRTTVAQTIPILRVAVITFP